MNYLGIYLDLLSFEDYITYPFPFFILLLASNICLCLFLTTYLIPFINFSKYLSVEGHI